MHAKKFLIALGILFSASAFAMTGDENIAENNGVYLKVQASLMIP